MPPVTVRSGSDVCVVVVVVVVVDVASPGSSLLTPGTSVDTSPSLPVSVGTEVVGPRVGVIPAS